LSTSDSITDEVSAIDIAGQSNTFEEQLAALLDALVQTSFVWHVAVAAYSYSSIVRADAS